jgi:hypothetical protein
VESYPIGTLQYEAARKRAQDDLGRRFDSREFHQMLLSDGALPFAALNSKLNRWIAAHRWLREIADGRSRLERSGFQGVKGSATLMTSKPKISACPVSKSRVPRAGTNWPPFPELSGDGVPRIRAAGRATKRRAGKRDHPMIHAAIELDAVGLLVVDGAQQVCQSGTREHNLERAR